MSGSNEYSAGLLPDASSTVLIILLSSRALVNLAAEAGGIPLLEENLLFLKTGFVNTKSNTLTLHFEDKNPIEQVLGYVKRLRDGKVKTKDGRPIMNSDRLPAYCYIVCDIESKMEERCDNFGLTKTADGMGYFGFNPNRNAYIEVISYDKMLIDAKKRNEAFFRKLGLPSAL